MAKTGGAAFPRPFSSNPDAEEHDLAEEGMTLRDYFAGQAITYIKCQGPIDFQKAAELSYQMADAMLIERQRDTKA